MASLQEMFDVRGKSVIVTGGASGIGLAYAEVMAANGARVCIFDLNEAGLDAVIKRMKADGADAWGQVVDVSDRPRMSAAFDAVADRHGRIDVVYANAGIDAGPGFMSTVGERIPEGAIDALDDHHWDRVIEVNLSAVYTTVKHAARHMKRTGGGPSSSPRRSPRKSTRSSSVPPTCRQRRASITSSVRWPWNSAASAS
jgi:NAD(P)-dependent dehydrogenase (short-subunit alcohol dehydrogenase family)